MLDPGDQSAATYSAFGLKRLEGSRLTIPGSPHLHWHVAEMYATLSNPNG